VWRANGFVEEEPKQEVYHENRNFCGFPAGKPLASGGGSAVRSSIVVLGELDCQPLSASHQKGSGGRLRVLLPPEMHQSISVPTTGRQRHHGVEIRARDCNLAPYHRQRPVGSGTFRFMAGRWRSAYQDKRLPSLEVIPGHECCGGRNVATADVKVVFRRHSSTHGACMVVGGE
jgi:hypothetical protein